ncbi:MAG: hypothetical protein JNK09_10855 [Prolixibacteraceae bacterium]|nr:hypothetical protein [Prolixibacteraceae bacterium]
MKIVINFLLRKSREATDGRTSICVRFTYKGKRVELSTGIYASSDQWNENRQRIKDKSPGGSFPKF